MAYRRGAAVLAFTPSFVPFTALFHLVMLAVRVVNLVLFGLQVRGREHLRGVERAILVSNHTLVLDPALLAHAIGPRRTYVTMLEETALIPHLGTFVRLLGGIPIPRGPGGTARFERGVEEAVRRIGFVHFFPEGECWLRNQEVRPFQRGAFREAFRLGLPIIPITTVLKERAWAAWRLLDLPPRVLIVIGPLQRPGAPAGTDATGTDPAGTFAGRGAARPAPGS
jgi:1-acyl-sn-glycerol-3-phosphate acyltransferase